MLELLGEVRVTHSEGSELTLSRHQRALLAALALDRGGVSSPHRLADAIWGEALPRHPTASLHNHISRLRAALPATMRIEAVAGGYRLVVADDELDVALFQEAWEAARRQDPSARVATLDRALTRWRGEPFAVLDTDDARAEAIRLTELHRSMRRLRAESLLALGRLDDAIAELESLRRSHPLNDEVAALTMRALVAAGRAPDALRLFTAHRARLADELGIDPSPALRNLEVAVIREDLAAEPPDAPDGGLPLPASTFRGRDEDLPTLARLVRAQRIVSLIGPGGVGKTRLALELTRLLAGEFPDGVVLIELAEVVHSATVADMAATRLQATSRTDVPVTAQVAAVLRGRSMLIVLDNCEHVIDGAAELVETIAGSSPRIRVVSTTRERLDVDGEHCWPVRPLALEPEQGDDTAAAVVLFMDRARAVRPDLVLDAHGRQLVAEICARLDGLPLALELAAARLSSLTLDEIAGGLDERFTLLNRGRRTAAVRHRSLRDVVTWSVCQLDDAQLDTLLDLSVFAGGFTMADATAVCRPRAPGGRRVTELVSDLVERSLLTAYGTGTQHLRFTFLETVRAFAREQLVETGAAVVVADRHADWALTLAEDAVGCLVDAGEGDTHHRLTAALPELRAAHRHLLDRHDADRAFRLSVALHPWAFLRMQSEVLAWAEAAAARFAGRPHPLAALVLASAAAGAWQRGDLPAAHQLVHEGRVAARPYDAADRGISESAGDLALLEGRLEEASVCYAAAVSASERAGDQHRLVVNLGNLALAAAYGQRPDEVGIPVARARALLGDHAAPTLQAWTDYCEGEALEASEPGRALLLLEHAIAGADAVGARFVSGVAGLTWLTNRSRAGDPRPHIPGLVTLLRQWHRAGLWTQQWTALRAVVELLARVGDERGAARLLAALSASRAALTPYGEDAARLAAVRTGLERRLGPELAGELAGGSALDGDHAVLFAIERLLALGTPATSGGEASDREPAGP